MRNPLQTIREARRQADSVLSTHEIAFAVLVENIADDMEFEKQLGFGLVAADGLAWWERSRFRYKLRQLHARALDRVEIRRFVAERGIKQLYAMKTADVRDASRLMARHFGAPTIRANGDGTYTHTYMADWKQREHVSGEYQWPDEIEIK